MSVKVFVSAEKIGQAKNELAAFPGRASQAIREALNRVGAGMKTDAVNETKQKYFLSASDIRKNMAYKKVSGKDTSVKLAVTGRRRDISEYKVTGSGEKLRVAVRKTGMKKLRTGFLSSQFKDKNNKPVVLWRPQGEGIDPVKRMNTLSVPQAVGNKETVKTMMENIHERFEKRLDQNIDRMIRGTFTKMPRGSRR